MLLKAMALEIHLTFKFTLYARFIAVWRERDRESEQEKIRNVLSYCFQQKLPRQH